MGNLYLYTTPSVYRYKYTTHGLGCNISGKHKTESVDSFILSKLDLLRTSRAHSSGFMYCVRYRKERAHLFFSSSFLRLPIAPFTTSLPLYPSFSSCHGACVQRFDMNKRKRTARKKKERKRIRENKWKRHRSELLVFISLFHTNNKPTRSRDPTAGNRSKYFVGRRT